MFGWPFLPQSYSGSVEEPIPVLPPELQPVSVWLWMDGGSWVDGMQALVERLGCGALSGDGKDWLVSQILQDILCVGGGGIL